VTTAEQREAARILRSLLAARREVQDLIDVGAYQRGANPLVDAAVDHAPAITAFLQQRMDDVTPADEAWQRLGAVLAGIGVR
jgi:flagellum-specific ATP synthase